MAIDLPLTSVVLDLAHESIGVLVVYYRGDYLHPTDTPFMMPPTHYASAPLQEWSISATGSLVPPAEVVSFIGDKPLAARISQIRAHQEATDRVFQPRAAPPVCQESVTSRWRGDERERQRKLASIREIFKRES